MEAGGDRRAICEIDQQGMGEGLLEKWRMGVIQPIFKKGAKKEVRNYHGVTIEYGIQDLCKYPK